MSKKEALQILMESPFYFKLSMIERKELIDEFLELATVALVNGFVIGCD
jgi:hypothetical protein